MFNKTKKQNPQSRVAQLLGTNDPARQAQAIESLIKIADSPAFSVTVTLDAATGQVYGVGSSMSLDAQPILRALAAGQQWLLDAMERAAAAKAQAQPIETTAPAGEQPAAG